MTEKKDERDCSKCGDKMEEDKKISTFSIPLSDEEEKDLIPMGKIIVVRSEEVCLTCGGYKRLQWVERVDGTRTIKEACLYCLTNVHTKANERDH